MSKKVDQEIIAISVKTHEKNSIDESASKLGIGRSEFVRSAVARAMEKIEKNTEGTTVTLDNVEVEFLADLLFNFQKSAIQENIRAGKRGQTTANPVVKSLLDKIFLGE